MLGIYKRGRVYYIQGTHNGEKIKSRSLDTTSKDVAQDRLHQLEKQLDNPSSRNTWSELTELFFSSIEDPLKTLTLKKYKFVAQRFETFLERSAIVSLSEITPATIAEYIADRSTDAHPTRKTPIGAEGIKSDLRVLRRFFHFALAHEYISKHPINRKKRLNSGISSAEPFSAFDTSRMLQFASQRTDKRGNPIDLYPILLTFLRTGLRISDVIEFPKTAVNFTENQIILETQKRKKTAYIPLMPDLKTALLAHLETLSPVQQACPWIFSTCTGKPINNLDAYLRRFWKRAGISKANAHRFRDTFAVELLKHGATLYDVAKILAITHAIAERHYTPYVKSLQERARGIMQTMPDLSRPGGQA